ncbi:cobalamin biosynthesis protein [Pelotomaculum schinkii]|uniref:Cobalamin biosynthesis protein CobD n=1 Tax=Pelotomaculum schinkii TaxID=78350 RepID=A0A4Y7RDI4_9FIRM|nr:adenosylcobinamide-phosphate synthase CbiB [Pelotomaculum schinkii]TEB06800.1 cobalamin biosynthesis protein [Pelotomaculum schinkii]
MPINAGLFIFAAYLLDLVLGDPHGWPHPVVLIGKVISSLEAGVRRFFRSPTALLVCGALVAVIVAGGSWLVTACLVRWSYAINYWFGSVLTVWIIYTTIAAKSLAAAACDVYNSLQKGNLAEARRKVGWIVGRDTEQMDAADVTRATVETVAENIVDGIVSPVFYALLGGAPLAMAYRAINTLDSMLGYKNERYINFGKASARLDDIANYIPARITGFLILAASWLLGMNTKGAISSMLRDSSSHPSPNSGIPEAAVAGSLEIRLGGLNYYQGSPSFRAYMGEDLAPLKPFHILQTVKIMYVTATLTAGLGLAGWYLLT